MNFKKIVILIFSLLIICCEEQNTNNGNDSLNDEPDSTEDNLWAMPSIMTNSSVLIGIESANSYNELTNIPENVEWLADTTLLSYAGSYVVLDYQFTCQDPTHTHNKIHKILVWDYTYLFKIIETGQVYKIKFEEYEHGVVLFKFAELGVSEINEISIITPHYSESFYFNFSTGLENESDWHFSLQKLMILFELNPL